MFTAILDTIVAFMEHLLEVGVGDEGKQPYMAVITVGSVC